MSLQRTVLTIAWAVPTVFASALPHILEFERRSLSLREDDNDDDDDNHSKKRLGTGAIVGIVIGVVAFALLGIAAACVFHLKLKKKKKDKKKRNNDNNRDGTEKEIGNNNEDGARNFDYSQGMGNVAAVGVGNTNTTPRHVDNNYTMNTSRNLDSDFITAPTQHVDMNADAQTDTQVGGSRYEMNTARSLLEDRMAVRSIDNDNERDFYNNSEKYRYGGPCNAPPPGPPPQYSGQPSHQPPREKN